MLTTRPGNSASSQHTTASASRSSCWATSRVLCIAARTSGGRSIGDVTRPSFSTYLGLWASLLIYRLGPPDQVIPVGRGIDLPPPSASGRPCKRRSCCRRPSWCSRRSPRKSITFTRSAAKTLSLAAANRNRLADRWGNRQLACRLMAVEAEYLPERLRQMKRDHEAWVDMVLSVGPPPDKPKREIGSTRSEENCRLSSADRLLIPARSDRVSALAPLPQAEPSEGHEDHVYS